MIPTLEVKSRYLALEEPVHILGLIPNKHGTKK